MKDKLTQRQNEILEFIRTFSFENGRTPTLSELAEGLSISRGSAYDHISLIRKKGLLDPKGRLRISDNASYGRLNEKISLYSSREELREKKETSSVFISRALMKKNCTYFAVEVHTEDMTDGGILPSDIAFIEYGGKIENGDIILFESDDRLSLRHIYFRKDGLIELIPENYMMGKKTTGALEILGKLILIQRRYV